MVTDALDASGQIAMAVFDGRDWKQQYHGRPPIRPAVCIGHIAQHEKLADGRYNIILRGVCRARVIKELAPRDARLYREAMLEPIGLEQDETPTLRALRVSIERDLDAGSLARLADGATLLEYVRDDDIPTAALLELISFTLVKDREKRYRLLEEGDADARAELVRREIAEINRMIRLAVPQTGGEYPRGYSPN
jgi:Lon protease-like protein